MQPSTRLATGVVALGATAGLALAASGAPARTAAQAPTVSNRGVGQVHIGMRYSRARAMGLEFPALVTRLVEDAKR